MQFDLEKTTPFGVGADEVVRLLQDPARFMLASGGTEEDSIRYDEEERLWHGEGLPATLASFMLTEHLLFSHI
jgi:hypothetical protein